MGGLMIDEQLRPSEWKVTLDSAGRTEVRTVYAMLMDDVRDMYPDAISIVWMRHVNMDDVFSSKGL